MYGVLNKETYCIDTFVKMKPISFTWKQILQLEQNCLAFEANFYFCRKKNRVTLESYRASKGCKQYDILNHCKGDKIPLGLKHASVGYKAKYINI